MAIVKKRSITEPNTLTVYAVGLWVLIAVALNGISYHSNEKRYYFNWMWSAIWFCLFFSHSSEEAAQAPGDKPLPHPQPWFMETDF